MIKSKTKHHIRRDVKHLLKSALLVGSLFAAGLTEAALLPIPITADSYNADVVVEKTAIPSLKVVTTASVDQGTNNGANTWMEVGFDPTSPFNGLPAPGTVITAPFGDVVLGGGGNTVTGVNSGNPGAVNYSFKMPPDYTAPNGILIDGDGATTAYNKGTFTLTTPAAYTLLSFAGSGGNGGCVVGVTVHHADGTTESGQFGCPDWFNGTSNVLFIANERCASTVNFTYANAGSGNPRIYFRDVALTNTTSPVTSIDLTYLSGPSGSHNDILAVSGAKTAGGKVEPITVTGYTHDFIVEAAAAKRGQVMAANGSDTATTQSMDNTANTGNSWYEMGFNINNPDGGGVPIPDPRVLTNSGLPAAGTTITNADADHVYTLAPDYRTNNAIWVAADTITSGTITLATPKAAAVLSLLAAAGNGPVNNIHLVTHHADSSMETNLVNVANWFDGTPYVYGANGRVDVGTAQFNNVRNTAQNPRLYPVDYILANTNSPVTSIDVINTNLSGGRIAIFALSGTLDVVKPSFATQPQSATVNVGANVQFIVSAIANAAVTYQWQKGTNGVFVNVTDGGNVSGATTSTLSVNSAAENDEADYRAVATDSAGSVNSAVAVLTVLSPLTAVTVPGDPITAYQPRGGSSPDAENVTHAIDGNTQKYLNRGLNSGRMSVPVGFIVSPSKGRTVITAMRLYTANDTTGRDPANYVLEGSINGGATWTLISSNLITLPDARNAPGNALAPLTQAIRQVRFANTKGYTMYRWWTDRVKGNETLMQIGEVELLGVIDTSPAPYFSQEAASQRAIEGTSATFAVKAVGSPTPTISWQRDTGSGFVTLNDGGNISGARTDTLTINPANMADAGLYKAVATNSAGGADSLAATLTVLSKLTDVTDSGDTITSFGDTSTTYPTETVPSQAIDNSTMKYRNGGIGLNAFTGFPPYQGPAGLIVTPASGYTVVTGLRIYNAADAPERDPASLELAGSDDGVTFTPIVNTTINLSLDRGSDALGLDPLTAPMTEVLFPNNRAFKTYRLTINHVRSDIDANSFQFLEMELLGVAGAPAPTLSITANSAAGTISISASLGGTLYSTADFKTWQNEGTLAAGTPKVITVEATGSKFYQIRP